MVLLMQRVGILVLAAASLIGGCGSSGSLVADQLDPVTGVTVTRSAVPLILYRDNSAQAAHARDYVYVGAIEINRMGQYRYFLWLGIWSTLRDPVEDDVAQRDSFESVALFVDGEPLRLDLQGWTGEAIGVSESVYPAPVASATDAYYAVTLDQIRLLSEAASVRLQTSGIAAAAYEPWDDQSRATSSLQRFVENAAY
jgi:hypothetical protein